MKHYYSYGLSVFLSLTLGDLKRGKNFLFSTEENMGTHILQKKDDEK